jgi:hypothetical protein
MASSVKVLQINARSIKSVNKLPQFKSMVALKKPKIIAVCESWLTDKIKNKDILSEGEYQMYRKDRTHKTGGGVFVAISVDIMSNELDKYVAKAEFHNEIVAVELVFNKGKEKQRIGLVCAYKPPDEDNFMFADNLKTCIEGIWKSGVQDLLVVGDFNLPDINWTTGYPASTRGLSFACANIFQEFGLDQYNTNPSRETNKNILDLVLCNIPEAIQDLEAYSDVLETDHVILEYQLGIVHDVPVEIPRYQYDFRRANFETLRKRLEEADLLLETGDVDLLCSNWTEKILRILDEVVPKKKVGVRNSTPWIDQEVRHISNIKERVRRKFHRLHLKRDQVKYKQLARYLRKLIHQKHNAYITACAESINTNPKKFWSFTRRNQKNAGMPKSMKWNNEVADTSAGKADLFNRFFSSVFTVTPQNLAYPTIEVIEDPQLSTAHAEENDILRLLKLVDASKSTGSDNLPPMILKQCAEQLAPSLTAIINTSLNQGKVPKLWKLAVVSPIHKKGPRSLVANYRPISLLPVASKLMERTVFNSIFNHLNPKIHCLQHGFRRGLSTTTQLLLVYEDIGNVLDHRGQVDTVYLDFSKAFDSVSHPLLIHKLRSYGLNGKLLEWFEDYLRDREQKTTAEGSTSELSPVISGVPQGSILGPLLFILYVNDMADIIHPGCKLALYADDAKVYCTIKDYGDCLKLQESLDKLHQWSSLWLLNFNPSKCSVMTITRKLVPCKFYYNIGGTILDRVRSFKDLGVQVEDTLFWDMHVQSQVKKASRMLYYITRVIGYRAPATAKRLLYLALVRPHLEFAAPAWTPLTEYNLRLIESIQRRATIYICNTKELSYVHRLSETNILPLCFRKEQLDMTLIYKILCGDHGELLSQKVQYNPRCKEVGRDSTRNTLLLMPARTETYAHYFFNRARRTWNSLPVNLRTTELKSGSQSFKFALIRYLRYRLISSFDVNNCCTWVLKCRCPTCRS